MVKKLYLIIFICTFYGYSGYSQREEKPKQILTESIIEGKGISEKKLTPSALIDSLMAVNASHPDSVFTDTVLVTWGEEEFTYVLSGGNGNVIVNSYYENGYLEGSYVIREGVRNGVFNRYYKNGSIRSSSAKHGEFCTPIFTYYETGELKSINFLEPCEKNGIIRLEYHKNGLLWVKIANTDLCERCEINTIYYPTGELADSMMLYAGKQTIYSYHKNGQMQLQGDFYNLTLSPLGRWQEWYPDGTLRREYYYHEDIPNQREGDWKWFDEKGNLVRWERYKDGKLTNVKVEKIPFTEFFNEPSMEN